MKCSDCNHELSDAQKLCPNCGTLLPQRPSDIHDIPAMSNGYLLGVLGFVSGAIGILIVKA